jgi:nicotinamidase/pyrazinamidase
MEAGSALLVVDLQVDFCPGGRLSVPDGDQVVPAINRYMELFREQGLPLLASRDWHPAVTSHFKDFGGIWPVHCVQKTPGAAFHPEMEIGPDVIIVSKGMDPGRDDYSAFQGVNEEGTTLPGLLESLGIRHLYVGGLATDYCVKETVLEGLRRNLHVTLLEDAVAAVNLKPDDGDDAIAEMVAAGAGITSLPLLSDD